jgi:hypothetical protein
MASNIGLRQFMAITPDIWEGEIRRTAVQAQPRKNW